MTTWTNVSTIRFEDCEHKGESFAFVRASTGWVSLGFALWHDGDIEVFMEPSDCQQVVKALRKGVQIAVCPEDSIRDEK